MLKNRYAVKHWLSHAAVQVFLMAVALLCLFPVFWMLRVSLMTSTTVFTARELWPAQPCWQNYAVAWFKGGFAVYFFNSILYTAAVVAAMVLIASLAAFAFSRLKFPGRNLLFYMFVAAMMIPLPGSFVPLFVTMNKLHLLNTRLGYILCMINVGLSVSILLLKTFFDKMPSDLEDAARIDGCNRLQIWWHVALPLARPAIAVVAIYNALNVWNEYILASLLLNDKHLMPLQQGLMVFNGAYQVDYPVLMAGLTMTVLPVVAIYLVVQQHIVRGFTSWSVSG